MGKKKEEYYGVEKESFVVSLFNAGMSARQATRKMFKTFNLPHDETVERMYRKKLNKLRPKEELPNLKIEETQEFLKAKQRVFDSSKKRFIITWAQSETPIHENFLINIEVYANFIDANIHVICGRYRNATSLASSNSLKKKERNKKLWDSRLEDYLDANRQKLHPYLQVLADVKVQVTASTPLTGFNGITGLESCIIGHPFLSLKSLPVLDGYPNKLLLTTGAVTLPNYTDTKAGAKGAFNHTLGFVVVELDGDTFHVRQVQCDENGDFYDLWHKVSSGKVSVANEPYPAIVFGDLHLTEEDEQAVKASFELVDKVKAKIIIVHDIFSGVSISHHELNNPVIQAQRELDGSNNLEKELQYMYDWFNSRQQYQFVSVMSNHPLWLDRWISSNDWRKSPNRALYLELANMSVNGQAPKGLIPYLLDKNTVNVISTGYNDSYRVCEFECALHGDFGNSGSRGSGVQFKNLNTKAITAHQHAPERQGGWLAAGTLTKLRLSYNKGLSAWLHSNIIIYPNGKASHINIIKGKYTTLI